jgi:hypothetical protein
MSAGNYCKTCRHWENQHADGKCSFEWNGQKCQCDDFVLVNDGLPEGWTPTSGFRNLLATLIFIFIFTFAANAQTETVCIDKETAAKCSKAFDEVVALREEVKAKTDALETLKAEIQRLQIQVAIQSTRATELEKQAVENRAAINAMIPALKKKKIGLINIF